MNNELQNNCTAHKKPKNGTLDAKGMRKQAIPEDILKNNKNVIKVQLFKLKLKNYKNFISRYP